MLLTVARTVAVQGYIDLDPYRILVFLRGSLRVSEINRPNGDSEICLKVFKEQCCGVSMCRFCL